MCIDNPTSVPSWVRVAGNVPKDKVGQSVFISTISVFADTSEADLDESAALTKYNGKDAMAETRATLLANMELYGPLKALSEKEAAKQFGARATSIRPALMVGPGDETDRFTYWPVRIDRGGDVLAPGDGSDPAQFIDACDLAEWTIRMVGNRNFGTDNATSPDYEVAMENLHNAALSGAVSNEQKRDPSFATTPQCGVSIGPEQLSEYSGWAAGFRDIARSTDVRTFIAAIVASVAAGNKLPFLFPDLTPAK